MGTFNTHIGLALGGIALIAATFIGRSYLSDQWFYVLVGAGVVAVLLGLAGLSVDGARWWRHRAAVTHAEGAGQQFTMTMHGGTHTYHFGPAAPAPATEHQQSGDAALSAVHISHRTLRLVDVPRQGKNIVAKTFEDCVILGPAILTSVSPDNSIINCAWDAEGLTIAIEMPYGTRVNTGMIGLIGCHFIRCTFRGVGFSAPPDTIRGSFPPEAIMGPPAPTKSVPGQGRKKR